MRSKKKILFLTWSLGLGHITRDLVIADQLKKLNPSAELSWLACPPASQVLRDAKENLLPEAESLADSTATAEEAATRGYQLNLSNYLSKADSDRERNLEVFRRVISEREFDLVIGDESYEVVAALIDKRVSLKSTFVAIHDFWGVDSMTSSPQEKLIISRTNRKYLKRVPRSVITYLFVGEAEDVPDRRFGFLLPNRRKRAKESCEFLGYIVPFDATEYLDQVPIRDNLGYGKKPLIICSIGGTAVGKELLILCGRSFPLLQKHIPNLQMILVCGPRLMPDSLDVPAGVEVRSYIPALWKHFGACDLAIVQAGGTTTAELTALRRPFIYFPLEEHFEQQLYIAARLDRQGAGIRMQYSQTTPESLAEMVLSNLGKKLDYPRIPTDGAKTAGHIINGLLQDGC